MMPAAFFLVCTLVLPFVSSFAVFPMNEHFYSSKTLEEFALSELGGDDMGYRRLIMDMIPSADTIACMENHGENTTKCLEGIEQQVENVESAIQMMFECLSPFHHYPRSSDTCPFDTTLFLQKDDLRHAWRLLHRCEEATINIRKQWNDKERPVSQKISSFLISHSGFLCLIVSIVIATKLDEYHDLLGICLTVLFLVWYWFMVHMIWQQLARTPSLPPLETAWNGLARASLDIDNLVKPRETLDSQSLQAFIDVLYWVVCAFRTVCHFCLELAFMVASLCFMATLVACLLFLMDDVEIFGLYHYWKNEVLSSTVLARLLDG